MIHSAVDLDLKGTAEPGRGAPETLRRTSGEGEMVQSDSDLSETDRTPASKKAKMTEQGEKIGGISTQSASHRLSP